jgi:galactokinase
MTITGNVPLGAGLSSSASVEVGTAFAVLGTLGVEMPLAEIALLCQRAENAFVGATVGIMDQFVICCGQLDHAVMIDTRYLTYTLAPIPPDVRIVICNSMVKHSLADGGGYNTRRAEMEAGLRVLQSHRPEIVALRDATLDDLDRWGGEMSDASLRRCRHVITEDERVLAAVEAFNNADLTRFGVLMQEAHVSFRDDFEASCAEIDVLVDLAVRQPGCYGARLTGGGFGGCTVNLVAAAEADAFTSTMRHGYIAATGIVAEIYISRASAGAHRVPAGTDRHS